MNAWPKNVLREIYDRISERIIDRTRNAVDMAKNDKYPKMNFNNIYRYANLREIVRQHSIGICIKKLDENN